MKSRTSADPEGAMEPSRRQTVLAGMAAGGPGAAFDAARLQKLFFLVDTTFRCPLSVLTDSGVESGTHILEQLPEEASRYMKRAARWILTTAFRPMLAGIYKQYPDMAVNSVLPLASKPIVRSTFSYPMPSVVSGMARVLDLFGTLDERRIGLDGAEADTLATYNDWRAVGEDIERRWAL